MSNETLSEQAIAKVSELSVTPPFIWPDSRNIAGVATYSETPPGKMIDAEADLVNGLLVGTSDATVTWIEQFMNEAADRTLCLILVLYPAGPTKSEHLKKIMTAIASEDGGKVKADIRLLTLKNLLADDGEHMTLPPTVIQYHNTKTGRTLLSIGSTGNAGHDLFNTGSLNLVFQPDDAVRDEWRRWFQYRLEVAAPLTPETCEIPLLDPAQGDPRAYLLWSAFELLCAQCMTSDQEKPTVDPQSGEVLKTTDGKEVVAWDGGKTALDPLASVFQKVYADSWLVTVDETTRLKPIKIPVKATLLGQEPERSIGTVTRKQSFSLQVLDDTVEKEVESCRKITDLLELLTFPLSKGNRLLPNTTKALLEKEVAARDTRGRKALWSLLIGPSAESIFESGILDTLRKKGFGDQIEGLINFQAKEPEKPYCDNEIIQNIIDSTQDDYAALKAALVQEYITRIINLKKAAITKDLNQMYRELGQGDSVPADKLEAVLQDVRYRLTNALSQRITPRPVYNRIGPPDLTAKAPEENWNQPLALLMRSARSLREFITDRYFQQKVKGLTFTDKEFSTAMDVFNDVIVKSLNKQQAHYQLYLLEEINGISQSSQQKCQAVWKLIKGGADGNSRAL